MTLTMDPQQRQLGAIGFDHMSYPPPQPQFTNPWASTNSASAGSHMFPAPLSNNNAGFDALAKQQAARHSATSMAYTSAPVSTPSLTASNGYSSSPYDQQQMLGLSQDLLNHPRSNYEHGYTGSSSPAVASYAPTSAPYIASYSGVSHHGSDSDRRHSSASDATSQSSFDAIDAGRGMVAMSQDLTTPRNIYGPRNDRSSSVESYGFPSTHSTHSSISSASTYPSYYGSMDSSVSEYSSQSDMESVSSRTLPRPSGLIGANLPPAPQSMMGQFNSKLSSSTQKKHKCKVCDKRFTRPSSLQTHMYSHTGEKPYACEVQGCGRHFSVVSNLRRHRKVHKGERSSDHGSPEGSWTRSD
ncbi:MAG: hypothetical protein L6R42_007098 [Xanthoria sp. 1 TBL-2021]|nr:MAG: hypothetical protein L6R42_007098 [Xanthoria sp. 1 TBL-2021]